MGPNSKRTQHGKRGGNTKAGSTAREGLNQRAEDVNKREPGGGSSSESHGVDTARSRTPAKDE